MTGTEAGMMAWTALVLAVHVLLHTRDAPAAVAGSCGGVVSDHDKVGAMERA